MAEPLEDKERPPLTEEEAEATFARLRQITSGLLSVPKAELGKLLAEKKRPRRRPSAPRQ